MDEKVAVARCQHGVTGYHAGCVHLIATCKQQKAEIARLKAELDIRQQDRLTFTNLLRVLGRKKAQ